MRFTTESGSEYEVRGDRMRRVNPNGVMTGDGTWIQVGGWRVALGEPAVFDLEGGPLDGLTRVTTVVTSIEEK